MFKHVIEKDDKFYVRRLTFGGFEHLDTRDDVWWVSANEYCAFNTEDDAWTRFDMPHMKPRRKPKPKIRICRRKKQ